MNENKHTTPQHAIAQMAYELWNQAGRPLGRDWEFWFRAEALLCRAAPVKTEGNGRPVLEASPPRSARVRRKSTHQLAAFTGADRETSRGAIPSRISPALQVRS